jgi:Na+/melibiose symporter-like transporter
MRSVILPVILAAIPYTVGAFAAWFVAASSQKRKEVYYHAAFSMFAAGIFFILVSNQSLTHTKAKRSWSHGAHAVFHSCWQQLLQPGTCSHE